MNRSLRIKANPLQTGDVVEAAGIEPAPHSRRYRTSREYLKGFVCGVILAGLLITTTGKANAYTQARRVVYAVFPASTERAALRVVGCETGHRYNANAYNRRSRATGYFQVLQGNAGRRLSLRGYGTLTIIGRLLFNPWYNARVALFLSHGGRDWGEWECQP